MISAAPVIVQLGPVQQNFFPCLRYNIRGFPSPNVTWLRDGVPLRRTNIVLDKPDPRWRDGRDAHELIGCLVFKMSTHLYNDVYTVVATNAYGSASRSVNVTILKPPGTSRGSDLAKCTRYSNITLTLYYRSIDSMRTGCETIGCGITRNATPKMQLAVAYRMRILFLDFVFSVRRCYSKHELVCRFRCRKVILKANKQ